MIPYSLLHQVFILIEVLNYLFQINVYDDGLLLTWRRSTDGKRYNLRYCIFIFNPNWIMQSYGSVLGAQRHTKSTHFRCTHVYSYATNRYMLTSTYNQFQLQTFFYCYSLLGM